MGGFWIASGLCLVLVAALLMMVAMTVTRRRDRRDSREVVELEVAICVQKNNGDLIIRQRRGKGLLGLGVGVIAIAGGGAMFIGPIVSADLLLGAIFMGLGLLILGVVVVLVSALSFQNPHVFVDSASRTVRLRYAGLRGTKEWPFDAIVGVAPQLRVGEFAAVGLAEILLEFGAALGGAATGGSSSIADRTAIALQLDDGRVVRIATAAKKGTRRVLHLLSDAIGKPVLDTSIVTPKKPGRSSEHVQEG